MKRANVTVSRNDVRPEGFKRWTVYAGGKAVFAFFHDKPDSGPTGRCGRCGGDGAAGAAGLCRDCEDGGPIIGERSSCALCMQEIEWSGDDWRDRGNGIDCLPFTKDGEVIQPGPTWMHQPDL